MKVRHNFTTIELYDSPTNAPITRFQMYNLNVLIDSGIGSDLNARMNHSRKLKQLIRRDPDAAIQQVNNMDENLRFIMSRNSPELNSFVVMIKKINDREINDEDLTDEGIKEIIKDLGKAKLPLQKVRDALTALKKKLDAEFEMLFPKMLDSPKIKEYYTKLKQRTSLVLKSVKEATTEYKKQIEEIDEFFLLSIKPKVYGGADGLEIKMIKGFEDTCNLINHSGFTTEARRMTTLTFYKTLETVQKIIKEKEKAAKRKNR